MNRWIRRPALSGVILASAFGWACTKNEPSQPTGVEIAPQFSTEQDSYIIVEKQTDPDGSPQLFDFTASYESARFSLSDGESHQSGVLDPGTYAVAEDTPAGWRLNSATCDDGSDPSAIELQAGETVTCTFNNEQDAYIIVEKQTDPDGSPQLFDFTASYESAGFSLSDGESHQSGVLDPGTYSVAENVPAGWQLKSATCDDGSDPSAIELQAGEIVTCTFNNEEDAYIIVEKHTDPAGSPQLFDFTASYESAGFSLSDGESHQSGVLDPGTYSVAETTPPGWDLNSATCDDGSDPHAIDLQAGEIVTCTFNNEQGSSIVVEKQTDPAGSPQSFDFTASYESAGFSLSDGESHQSGVLDPGTYSVAENVPAGWRLKSATCDDGSDPSAIDLQGGETVTCTFNNEQDSYIIVEKHTDPAGSPQSFDFTASYESAGFSLSDGESHQSGVLDPAVYSVAENVPAGWDLKSATCDDGSDPSAIELQAGEIVTCTFNNEEDAYIIVEKYTDPAGSTQSFDFTASYESAGFSLSDGESHQSGVLDPGTYSVAESPVAGWDLNSATCDDGSDPHAIDLQAGEIVTCTFNNKQSSYIIVEKHTDPAGSPQSFDFTASYESGGFSLSDGESYQSGALDPGIYSVAENVPAGWQLKSATCDDGSDPSAIELQGGETVTCTFNNEEDAYIIVEKYTDPAGSTQLFDFTASYEGGGFSLSDGQSHQSAVLDPGTYTVAENIPAGWELNSATCDDGSDPHAIDLQAGEIVTCTFNNEQDAYIIVEKHTDPAGSTQLFDFTASYEGGGFSLSDGQSHQSGALDPGTYTVAESPVAGWDLNSAMCDDGSDPHAIDLQAGEIVTCTFNNRQRGRVKLTKLTNGADTWQLMTWSFELRDANGNVIESRVSPPSLVEFDAMLIPGDEYALCETGIAAGWTLEWMGDPDGDGVANMVIPMVANVSYDPVDASTGYSRVYDPNYQPPPATPSNDTRCVSFLVDPGETEVFQIDNQYPGGEPRTIGFWKNWNTCTTGRQYETAAKNGGPDVGWYILDDLLNDPGYTIGTLALGGGDCPDAVAILDKRELPGPNGREGRKMANDAAYNLAAQLLAAQLNLSASAETCGAVVGGVNDAQSLLASIGFDGEGSFLAPKGRGGGGQAYANANTLASLLDVYNNGSLCGG